MYTIKKGCVGCHFCELECPTEAIRVKDGRYQIDQMRCIQCGKCVSLCHLNLIYDDSEANVPPKHPVETYNCDILVIGAGGVGTAAAARAAYLGYHVILLEAAKHFGGGTYLAHGAFFPGSDVVYPRLGMPDTLENTVAEWAERQTGSKTPIEKLRRNVKAQGQFIDWFDSLDPTYTKPFVYRGEQANVTFDMEHRYINKKSTDDSIGPGWLGSWITEKLFEAGQRLGVQYFNETAAKHFILDEAGKVSGVLSEDPGGLRIFKAKAFVLGTGGYIMNDARMKAIDPNLIRGDASYLRLNVPTNIGDGHDMVSEIGGDVDYSRGGARGPTHHPYCFAVNKLIAAPEVLFVTDEGKREFEHSLFGMVRGTGPISGSNCEPSEVILRSKTGKCYALMDDTLYRKLVQNLSRADDGTVVDYAGEIEREIALDDWPAKRADTIEGLAVKLHMEPEVLKATVERFNQLCASGKDTDFGKNAAYLSPIQNGPFYAFLGQNFDNGASRGGISIDGEFHVKKKNGDIFSEIYCAGDAATYSWHEDIGPVGLCGGLGGSWASGFQIINYITEEHIDILKSRS